MSVESQMKIAVILSAYDKMSSTINAAVNKAQAKLSGFAKKSDALADRSFKTGRNMIASGLAVGAPLYEAIQAAQEFETKMVDIRKQMKFDTPEAVKNMSSQVFQLGKELPIATSEIQDMITSGLRMGIAEDKIIDYTRSVTKMSVAFDMSGAEIADSMGKISKVFNIPIDKVNDFADAINYLDDNTMAKGPELIDVLQRIGGSAKALNPKNAAALAATMLSLGESAETSGSGINTMVNRLSSATMQAGKFQEGMKMLGLSSEKMQNLMSNKSTAQFAILEVFEKIQNLKPEKQTEALIRLFGNDAGPKMMKLANNVGEYKRQLALVNGQEKGSMNKEYQKRITSSAAQFQLFKNSVTKLSVTFGNSLLPTFNKAVVWLRALTEKLGKFIEKNPVLVEQVGKIAAGFAAVALVGGSLSMIVGGVASTFGMVAKVVSGVIKVFSVLGKVFQAIRLIIMLGGGPILLIIAAIGVAAFLIYKYWDQIKAFFIRLWNGIKAIFKATWEWIKKMFLNYTAAGLVIKHWDKISAFFSNMWAKIKAVFSSAYNFVKEKFMAVVDFVFGIGKKFYDAGANIINSIIEGIKSKITKVTNTIKGVAEKIRNFFPFSPAKEGPLKDIHRVKIVETIAQSIKPNALVKKMNSVAKGVADAGYSGGGNSSAGGINVTMNFNLSGSATKQDAKIMMAEAKKQFKDMMKQYNGQNARLAF